MVGGIGFFFPKKNTQEVKMVKKKQTPEISFYHQEYKERYDTYQKAHQALSKKEVITLVNMNRDFDFYGKIIKQEHPNDLNTIVNKYYQLDETYEPSDLVEINTNAGTYGSSYSKHTARKVVYDDFQALKQACINKGFELYVTSGYRSTVWQKEIYNHMVETYSVERADDNDGRSNVRCNTQSKDGETVETAARECIQEAECLIRIICKIIRKKACIDTRYRHLRA